jgi:hypothetical protein
MTIQQFKRSYQLAPIILVQGIAAKLKNGQMTILTLTEGSDSVNYADDNQYFAHFEPVSGGTLLDFTPAEYPLASMSMAANAMIQNGLKISMKMVCPARNNAHNYPALQATITRIIQQLTAHDLAGGSYTVATPAFIYANCLLLNVRDISNAGDKKVQGTFQLDFVQPLITQQAAAQTFNSLYAKLANNLPAGNPPQNSGLATSIGNAPANQPQTPAKTSGLFQ